MSGWFYKKVSQYAGYLAIAALFGLTVFCANIEIKDVDLWLHLAVGKHIIQTLSIPRADFLSCTVANTPWIDHEWLFQTLVYSAYSHAGIEGLINLKVAVVVLTFVLLLFLGYSREQQLGPIIVLLLVLLVYQFRLTLRPDMFSLLFFVLYICLLGMNLDKRWSLWAAVLVQIIWTNMHGFFIFGPILVLTSLAAEWMKRRIVLPFEWNQIGRLSDEEYRRLRWMFLLVILSCLANPYFVQGAWYPVKVLFSIGGSKIFFAHIQELQKPFTWGTILDWQLYFQYKLLIVVSFSSFVLNRRKVDVNALLIWFVFLLFSLCALRNIVFFAFTAYFAFLANFQYLTIEEFLPARWNNAKFQAIWSTALKAVVIIWIINYGHQLMFRGYYDFDKFERKSEFGGLSQRNFAHKAADFLVYNHIRGNFFNDFNSGAYLVGRASPDIKVFIDGRTEVYGAKFYKNHRKIWEGDTALFEEAVNRYHLTGAFLNSVYVPAPEKFIRYLYDSEDWTLVYFDYDAAIFLRDIPENAPWNRYRIDLAQWQTQGAELLKIGTFKVDPYRYVNRAYALYNMGFPQKAESEANEALRIEPYNAKSHKLLGKIYNERGEYARGFEYLRKAKLTEPDDIKIRYQMALALYHLGEIQKAEEQCQRVLSRSPKAQDAQELMSLIRAAKQ
ncbi:MAG: tetratricopeptide repeat protein [Candidatus Omnitrophica bacterium]|nr:tetratricopeptide repeat protein [Candidatus Omnitrophota bacterium]